MKKITLIATLILAMSTLTSCGGNNNNDNNNNASPTPTATQDTIDTKEETNTTVDDNIANDAGNAIENTGDAVGDMAEDAGRAVDNAVDGTANAVGDVTR